MKHIHNKRKPWENANQKRRRRNNGITMTKDQIIKGIMDGTIASAVSDTGATSTAGTPNDPFESSNKKSNKVFRLPTGGTATATSTAKLLLSVREPANEVDIIPNLEQTLLSTSKFADAGYTAVYDKDEINFYNSNTIKIEEAAVIRGYRCTRTGLWRVPLVPIILNENTDTVLLDCRTQTLNSAYEIPSTDSIREHLQASIEGKHIQYSMYMNSPASNNRYDTSMPQPVFQQRQHGSRQYVAGTTAHGH